MADEQNNQMNNQQPTVGQAPAIGSVGQTSQPPTPQSESAAKPLGLGADQGVASTQMYIGVDDKQSTDNALSKTKPVAPLSGKANQPAAFAGVTAPAANNIQAMPAQGGSALQAATNPTPKAGSVGSVGKPPTGPASATAGSGSGSNKPTGKKTDWRAFFKRNRLVIGALAVILFALLSIGVIWYIREIRRPIAPTAPISVPKAGEEVCTVEYVIEETCDDLVEATIDQEDKKQFNCAAPAGTDQYSFQVRYDETGDFNEIARSDSAQSPLINYDSEEYFEVRCVPCAGEYCAPDDNVAENCTLAYQPEVPEEPDEPGYCNDTCETDDQCADDMICHGGSCRIPTCPEEEDCICDEEEDKSTGFYIEKYHDIDGDGTRDSNEEGLDWTFEWQLNDDGTWREYVTHADNNGRGGNISHLEDGDKVKIREKLRGGWQATTASQKEITVEDEKLILVVFGNREAVASPQPSGAASVASPRPASSPSPASPSPSAEPEELPEAGSVTQTVVISGLGLAIILYGLRRLLVKF